MLFYVGFCHQSVWGNLDLILVQTSLRSVCTYDSPARLIRTSYLLLN